MVEYQLQEIGELAHSGIPVWSLQDGEWYRGSEVVELAEVGSAIALYVGAASLACLLDETRKKLQGVNGGVNHNMCSIIGPAFVGKTSLVRALNDCKDLGGGERNLAVLSHQILAEVGTPFGDLEWTPERDLLLRVVNVHSILASDKGRMVIRLIREHLGFPTEHLGEYDRFFAQLREGISRIVEALRTSLGQDELVAQVISERRYRGALGANEINDLESEIAKTIFRDGEIVYEEVSRLLMEAVLEVRRKMVRGLEFDITLMREISDRSGVPVPYLSYLIVLDRAVPDCLPHNLWLGGDRHKMIEYLSRANQMPFGTSMDDITVCLLAREDTVAARRRVSGRAVLGLNDSAEVQFMNHEYLKLVSSDIPGNRVVIWTDEASTEELLVIVLTELRSIINERIKVVMGNISR